MSRRDFAKSLIDQIPENKLLYVIAYLEGVIVPDEPDETPNADTLEAMSEVDHMIANGTGEHFAGSTEDFFKALAES